MAADCRRFYLAQDGDGCWDISAAAGISLTYVSLPHSDRTLETNHVRQ
jgi:hypothetical protein